MNILHHLFRTIRHPVLGTPFFVVLFLGSVQPDRANDVDHFFRLFFSDSLCCFLFNIFFPFVFACCGFFILPNNEQMKKRHGDDGGRVTTIDARRWPTGGFCTMKQVYEQVCALYILFIFDWFSLPGRAVVCAHFGYNSLSLVCTARFRCPVIWFLYARYYSNQMRTKWNIKIDSSRV